MPRFTSYDGTDLAYSATGAGTPLVCLAGGPGFPGRYFEDLAGLAAVRTLVLLDTRGTGQSELPSDPSTMRFDRLAADLEALRVHLGLETMAVLGHSAGAVTAQVWAAQHPASVERLVLLTPSDHLQGGTRADVPAVRETYADEPWYAEAAEAMELLKDAPPSQVPSLRRAVVPFQYVRWDEAAQAHAARMEPLLSKRAQAGYIAGADQVSFADLLTGLRAVTAPVLVVAGTRDAVSGVAAPELVAGAFPDAAIAWVEDAGHHPWIDQPTAFRAAVDPFLLP
ncbi:MAG: translation initiation factor [Frankiales bacterium]|nr:translation initiation factor [Frankiales bacterium]